MSLGFITYVFHFGYMMYVSVSIKAAVCSQQAKNIILSRSPTRGPRSLWLLFILDLCTWPSELSPGLSLSNNIDDDNYVR